MTANAFPDPVAWFPQCVLDVVAPRFLSLADVDFVVMRDLQPNDPSKILGISAVDWEPLDFEMDGTTSSEAALAQHNYLFRYMVKESDEQRGRRIVNDVSRSLRVMLARDQELRVALAALSHHDSSAERIERIQRWGVARQRLAEAMIDGQFVAASGTDFYVQTETIQGF